ncbi:hypothetical protein [Actinacidiphila acididurans]|uniref:Uncharacterized protein n=1 Tax=Actinacidiphila acididurans TaxID=2784346 RepID=A0ABS2TT64_9ACTN|nr:hypothetical protein [Actinacidiphila acididurans]MBM9506530.1 hypothetical protein [Actinacidiphila acididurans]
MAVLALVGGLFVAGAVPAGADAPPAAKTVVAKPRPVPPAGVAVGTVNVPKPRTTHPTHSAMAPMAGWSVSLTASTSALWPTRYTTLTATASADVGPTTYYIIIYNDAGSVVGFCGNGTVCSVAVTSPTPATHYFHATVADSAGTTVVAYSPSVEVDWYTADLSLAAGLHTLPVGNSTVVTETSSRDIGLSPFWVQIWDTTTGTWLGQCGTGTTCSVTVSQSVATTHTYAATLAGNTPQSGAVYPPAQLQTTSPVNYITWTGSGLQVALTATAPGYNTPVTVTATANIDVGPTPYWIEIFTLDGTRLITCAAGSTCSYTFYPARYPGETDVVAFLSANSTTLPPAAIQASSNTVATWYYYLG